MSKTLTSQKWLKERLMRENKDNILVPVEITVETLKAKIYLIRGQSYVCR